MQYEYEAVNGNQDLFRHNSDGQASIITIDDYANVLFWRYGAENMRGDIVAERKVTEKYIPKAGDVFRIIDKNCDHGECLCIKSNEVKVGFEYLKDDCNLDSVSSLLNFKFIRKHDDKAANPVNFTSEKYVPRVGDIFAIKNKMGEISPIVFVASSVGINSVIVNPLLESVTGSSNKAIYFSDADFLLLKRPSTK